MDKISFIYGELPAGAEKGEYHFLMVLLSYLVASFASYTALALSWEMANSKDPRHKRIAHFGGALAMGAGIWSMHFIGMLAYKMRMLVYYDPLLTLLSLLVAIAVAYRVLALVSRETLSLQQIFAGAVWLGLGICSMHYIGMASMTMDADMRYIPSVFAV